MKKTVLIALGTIFLIFVAVFIIAFIMSFKVVKKNTDQINANLKKEFARIVLVPEVIGPELKSLETIVYKWDMITKENETIPVLFIHQTGIVKNQDKIIASVEMPEGADPSIFHKVLPAVVSDSRTVSTMEDLEQTNLGPNEQVGYNKVDLYHNAGKVVKIAWEFDKSVLIGESQPFYDKLYSYPEWLIKTLYVIQQSTLEFLKP